MSDLLENILFLEKVDIFSSLSIEELSQLAQIVDTSQYQEDEILFRQGDPGNYAYIILSGKVELFLESGTEGRQTLLSLEDGACFGEMALLDGKKRSASARISTESLLARIKRDDFLRVMMRYPTIALGIINQISTRLRNANQKYREVQKAIKDLKGFFQNHKNLFNETDE